MFSVRSGVRTKQRQKCAYATSYAKLMIYINERRPLLLFINL